MAVEIRPARFPMEQSIVDPYIFNPIVDTRVMALELE